MITKELVCLDEDSTIRFVKPLSYLTNDFCVELADNNVFIFFDANKSYRQYRLVNETKQYLKELNISTLCRNSAIIYLNLIGRGNIKPFIEDGIRKVTIGNHILDEKLRVFSLKTKKYLSASRYLEQGMSLLLDDIKISINVLELFYLLFSESNDYNPYSGDYSVSIKKNMLINLDNMFISDLEIVKMNRSTTGELTHKMYDLNVLLKESYNFDDLLFDLSISEKGLELGVLLNG